MANSSDPSSTTDAPSEQQSSSLIEAEVQAIDELYDRVRSGDIYSVLGISPDSDVQYIRKVYYELSRSWHPDQFYRRDIGAYKQKLEDIFVGINRAYTILTDPRRRADYDTEHDVSARADTSPAPRRPGADGDAVIGPQAGAEAVEHEVAFRTDQRAQREQDKATQQLLVTTTRRRRRRGRIPGMEKVHEQVMARLGKARRHFKAAEREAEAGNFVAAASNAYMAMTFDPEEPRYGKSTTPRAAASSRGSTSSWPRAPCRTTTSRPRCTTTRRPARPGPPTPSRTSSCPSCCCSPKKTAMSARS
jgi:curved DNA-binding protein CbpA